MEGEDRRSDVQSKAEVCVSWYDCEPEISKLRSRSGCNPRRGLGFIIISFKFSAKKMVDDITDDDDDDDDDE